MFPLLTPKIFFLSHTTLGISNTFNLFKKLYTKIYFILFPYFGYWANWTLNVSVPFAHFLLWFSYCCLFFIDFCECLIHEKTTIQLSVHFKLIFFSTLLFSCGLCSWDIYLFYWIDIFFLNEDKFNELLWYEEITSEYLVSLKILTNTLKPYEFTDLRTSIFYISILILSFIW